MQNRLSCFRLDGKTNEESLKGVIWNVFSLDQWGVQLGKVLAKKVIKDFSANDPSKLAHDPSTNAIITRLMERM